MVYSEDCAHAFFHCAEELPQPNGEEILQLIIKGFATLLATVSTENFLRESKTYKFEASFSNSFHLNTYDYSYWNFHYSKYYY